jgi:hypothetical protein
MCVSCVSRVSVHVCACVRVCGACVRECVYMRACVHAHVLVCVCVCGVWSGVPSVLMMRWVSW